MVHDPTSTPTARLILAALASNREPMTSAQIMETISASKSATYEALASLADAGKIGKGKIAGRAHYVLLGTGKSEPKPSERKQRILGYLRSAPKGDCIERTVQGVSEALSFGVDATLDDLDDLRLHGAVWLDGQAENGGMYFLGPELPAERVYHCGTRWAYEQSQRFNSYDRPEIEILDAQQQLRADAVTVMMAIPQIELCSLIDYPTWATEAGYGPGNLWASDLEISIMSGLSPRRVRAALAAIAAGEIYDHYLMRNKRLGRGNRVGRGNRNGTPVYRRVLEGCMQETVGQDIGVEVVANG